MPNWLERLIQQLSLPVIVLALTFLGAPYFTSLPASVSDIFATGPYWAALIALILAIAFNRSRVALYTLALVGGFFIFRYFGTEAPLWQFVVYGLTPVNLAIISCYSERGLFTLHGYLRLVILGSQAGILAWFATHDVRLIDAWLQFNLNDLVASGLQLADKSHIVTLPAGGGSVTTIATWSAGLSAMLAPITQLEFVLLGLAGLIIIITSWQFYTPVAFALLGAAAGYYLLILSRPETLIVDAYMLASLALICIGLLRDSHNMAYRDELTTLPQRRAFNEQLLAVGQRYSLAMLDIDHFKKFNDTHGHDVGDQVLQMVASQINKVRGGGRAFRYGGEEFAVIFNGKDKADAAYSLEQVRKSIAAYAMVIREHERVAEADDELAKGGRQRGSYHKANKKVHVTISVGVAERDLRGQTPEEVLKLADEALYKAKKNGRNQIVIS